MPEYIDREQLIKELWKAPAHFRNGDITYGVEISIDLIKKQPTADVVPVVRCSQCKYSRELDKHEKKFHPENNIGCVLLSTSYHNVILKPDYFCSYGERKADNG